MSRRSRDSPVARTAESAISSSVAVQQEVVSTPLRVEVALVPRTSRFAPAVQAAAEEIGVSFVTLDESMALDLVARVLVVDFTQVTAARDLDSTVIAISEDQTLECYDVIGPEDVENRLCRSLRNLVELERLQGALRHQSETIQTLNDFGLALSAVTDRTDLLTQMLTYARRVLSSDGGSIYLIEDGHLIFGAAQNDTIDFKVPRGLKLPLDSTSLVGHVAMTKESLNIPNVQKLDSSTPYQYNAEFDRRNRYTTGSVLLVPMMGREGRLLGVLTLINRKRVFGAPLADFGRVEPFDEHHAEMARSLASQAAVTLENYRLYSEIRHLFEGFVSAAVQVIEARDASTAGHSHRVAAMTLSLARACNDSSEREMEHFRFSPRDIEELRFAAVLHDFGKVGVPEHVLTKADRLYPWEQKHLEYRFQLVALHQALQARVAGVDLENELKQIRADLSLCKRMARANYRPRPADLQALREAVRRWRLPDVEEPVIRPRDVHRLCIPIGSLDAAERRAIEEHVTHTYNFLKAIPWTPDLRAVPDIAHAHHEKLDGSGYPRGLVGEDIPAGAQLMTIVDIFDALTAGDRPYKASMSVGRAVWILREQVSAGKLNEAAVELFAAQRLWKGIIGE